MKNLIQFCLLMLLAFTIQNCTTGELIYHDNSQEARWNRTGHTCKKSTVTLLNKSSVPQVAEIGDTTIINSPRKRKLWWGYRSKMKVLVVPGKQRIVHNSLTWNTTCVPCKEYTFIKEEPDWTIPVEDAKPAFDVP